MNRFLGLTAAAIVCASAGVAVAQEAPMSFFITSVSPGKGGDLGGLAGADAYCDKLVDHYDRYGAGRNPHSDGKRNHTRIGAEIDCERGNHRDGIADMVDLLQDKKFRVPSPDPT